MVTMKEGCSCLLIDEYAHGKIVGMRCFMEGSFLGCSSGWDLDPAHGPDVIT